MQPRCDALQSCSLTLFSNMYSCKGVLQATVVASLHLPPTLYATCNDIAACAIMSYKLCGASLNGPANRHPGISQITALSPLCRAPSCQIFVDRPSRSAGAWKRLINPEMMKGLAQSARNKVNNAGKLEKSMFSNRFNHTNDGSSEPPEKLPPPSPTTCTYVPRSLSSEPSWMDTATFKPQTCGRRVCSCRKHDRRHLGLSSFSAYEQSGLSPRHPKAQSLEAYASAVPDTEEIVGRLSRISLLSRLGMDGDSARSAVLPLNMRYVPRGKEGAPSEHLMHDV